MKSNRRDLPAYSVAALGAHLDDETVSLPVGHKIISKTAPGICVDYEVIAEVHVVRHTFEWEPA